MDEQKEHVETPAGTEIDTTTPTPDAETDESALNKPPVDADGEDGA